ncbi:hypothetical protein EON83_11095 [bacterium]|nr:MAG: hypothetical protein EON83_11095 [bacterium]
MAFNTSNDWSAFENVDSGENGTVEGLLPLEDAASAFRYRKILRVDVLGADPDNLTQPIKGNWKVRVRADATKNADGSYAGAILFEQEVVWFADVIAFDLGGLLFVTWSPRGSAGSGTQLTSICDSETCAVLANPTIATPEELAAYGATGAWRFLNEVNVDEDDAPLDKFNAEAGFVPPDTFSPEGSVTAGGGVSFYCEWQSAGYAFEIPEGAILETVFDRWQVGTIDDEALFKVSFKAGESGTQALSDAWSGQTWSFQKSKGALVCLRTRTQTLGKAAAVQVVPKVGGFRAAQHGHTLTVALQSEDDIFVTASRDDGRTWTGEKVTNGIKFLGSVSDERGCELVVFGTATAASSGIAAGDFVRAVLTRGAAGWQLKEKNKIVAARAGLALPAKPKGAFSRQGTAIVWLVSDSDTTQVWRSLDNGLSFDLASN